MNMVRSFYISLIDFLLLGIRKDVFSPEGIRDGGITLVKKLK